MCTMRTSTLLLIGILTFGCRNNMSGDNPQPRALTGDNAMATSNGRTDASQVQKTIANWPEVSRKAADMMIAKYGPPNEATATHLVWWNNGPWKYTKISNKPVDHRFPMPHKDVMEQAVNYRVPPDKFDELAMYDGSVIAERTKGEISARCDKEAANFLALNLAHEIINGKRTVEEARSEYANQVKLMMNNQPAPYTEKLMFTPQSNTADPDTPARQ
jgi:hypothetical protein